MIFLRNFMYFLMGIFGFISLAIVGRLFIWNSEKYRFFAIRNISMWSSRSLTWMNFRVRIMGVENFGISKTGILAVSNHVSYLDIIVAASVRPFIFLPSVEIGENWFQGFLSSLGGSIFIERRTAFSLKRDMKKIGRALAKGFSILLFPEGTTSGGEGILPFKSSLYVPAMEQSAPIIPICLNYRQVNGEKITRETADRVFYYGGRPFFPQLWKLLSLTSLDVDINILPAIEQSENDTRRSLALKTHEAIKKVHIPI